MSYNLSVNVIRESEVYCAQSITGNLDCIFNKAIGQDGLRSLDGLPVSDVVSQLTRAYDHITDFKNRRDYQDLTPPNGWGSHRGAAEIIRELLISCRENPDGIIRIG